MRRRGVDERAQSRGDTARFLGLTGRGGWLVAGLFLITQLTLAFTSNARLALTPPDLGALAILVAITVIVMFPGPYPLSHVWSIVIVLGVAAIVALVNSVLPVKGWPGYESWQFGAITMVLLALGLRGRNIWAWTGMLLATALTVCWTVSTGQGVLAGINLIDRNAGTLLIGTVFSIGIRRSIRWITSLNLAEQRQASDEAFARATLQQRRDAMEALNAIAVPALMTIADDRMPSVAERDDFLVLEASLRDAVRAPGLAREPLASTVRLARMSGREVVLLDDDEAQGSTDADRDSLLAMASGRLSATSAKHVTIRLFTPPDAAVALTMVEDATPPVLMLPSGSPEIHGLGVAGSNRDNSWVGRTSDDVMGSATH
jgi:hypothetical protein